MKKKGDRETFESGLQLCYGFKIWQTVFPGHETEYRHWLTQGLLVDFKNGHRAKREFATWKGIVNIFRF